MPKTNNKSTPSPLRRSTMKPVTAVAHSSSAGGSSNFSSQAIRQDSFEGQLALDVYQTPTEIVVLAPIAGVKLEDINVSMTEDVLSIKGKRYLELDIPEQDYLTQECFWGDFSRSIVLPASVDANGINATLKDAVLKITIPRTEPTKTKIIRIKEA